MISTRARPRLLHVTTVPDSLWAFFDGQIRYLTDHGFDVEAVSSPGPLLQRFAEREHVPVHALPMARRLSPRADLIALWRMWRLLVRRRPDIVHAHTPKGGLVGTAGAWLARVPVRIYHIHGFPYLTATGWRQRLLRAAERLSCRLATRVLCVSPSVAAVAVRDDVCPPGKLAVLAAGTINGIDAEVTFDPTRVEPRVREAVRDRFGIPHDAVVVGFVGRLVRDKGIVELSAAWRELAGAYPALHLLVGGPLEDGDPVPPAVLAYLRAAERVHLAGQIEDMPGCFASLDVFVLPTYREGFPLVPLEAAAMGLPVVATSVPGCVDAVVDGVTGTLVPARDAAALAAAVRRYVEEPGLRRRHGQAGRQRVLADFRPEVVWSALLAEYRRLLPARAGETRHGDPA